MVQPSFYDVSKYGSDGFAWVPRYGCDEIFSPRGCP